jgi:Cu-Zn family superoxide dismutase
MAHHMRYLPVILAALLAAGCASMEGAPSAKAVAKLAPTKGNTVAGTVTFEQIRGVVRVSGTLAGLKPNAEHGFHVHEKGDCSSGDGMSAGGHFNPDGLRHGHHASEDRHAGDMPNLKADAAGNATFAFDMRELTIGYGSRDIVGKGLIVHRDPDVYKSQPAGNAGPRLACAVIAKS